MANGVPTRMELKQSRTPLLLAKERVKEKEKERKARENRITDQTRANGHIPPPQDQKKDASVTLTTRRIATVLVEWPTYARSA